MHYLFLLWIILLPAIASGADRAPAGQWVGDAADAANPEVRALLPGVPLDANAQGAFVDSRSYAIGNRRYRLLYQVFDSREGNPMAFCGGGHEIYLSVHEVSQSVPVEHFRTLVSSCLQTLSLESQETGCSDSEFDFSSVVVLGDTLTITWAGTRAVGPSQRRYSIRDGQFILQASTAGRE